MKEQWRLYNGYLQTRRSLSKLIVGLPFAFVDNSASALFKEISMIGSENLINVLPANSKTKPENAFKMKVLINNQLYRANFVRKALDFIIHGLVTGTAPAKIPLRVDIKNLIRRKNTWNAMAQSDWYKATEEYTTRRLKPDFVPLDFIVNTYPSALPQSSDVQELDYMITEDWQNKDYFTDRKDTYFNMKGVVEEDMINEFLGYKGGKEAHGISKKVRYWERHGRYKQKGKVYNYIIGVTNKTNLVRFERNQSFSQKIPFVMGSNFVTPFLPYGRGENEPIKNTIYQLNDLENAMQDNVNNLVHSMWTVLSGSPLANKERIYSDAGAVLIVNRHDEIAPLQQNRNDIVQSAGWMMNNLKADAQFTIGSNDASMGTTPKRKEAVGAILAMQRVAAAKYAKKMYTLLQQPGTEVAQFFGEYNQQWITEPIEVPYRGTLDRTMSRLVTPNQISQDVMGIDITPDDLEGEFIYIFNIDVMRLQEEVLRQQLQNLYMFLQKQNVVGVDLRELLKNILYTYPLRNLDKIMQPVILTPNEIKLAIQTLMEAGWGLTDPSGNPIDQAESGQMGGRPEMELNPKKMPRATNSSDIQKGATQKGQKQNMGLTRTEGL